VFSNDSNTTEPEDRFGAIHVGAENVKISLIFPVLAEVEQAGIDLADVMQHCRAARFVDPAYTLDTDKLIHQRKQEINAAHQLMVGLLHSRLGMGVANRFVLRHQIDNCAAAKHRQRVINRLHREPVAILQPVVCLLKQRHAHARVERDYSGEIGQVFARICEDLDGLLLVHIEGRNNSMMRVQPEMSGGFSHAKLYTSQVIL